MSTEEKTKLVPKLRFPEFRVMDGWALNVIGDYLDESRVPSSLNDPSKRITVRLHLLGVERREHRGTESTESTNNFSRKSGQFIYGKQNIHKGAFGLVPAHLDGFETSQDLPCFDFKPRCHPLWFCYHLSRENVYCALELKMTGTGSKRLNEKTFLTLSIATPKYPEQEKIAHCLNSLDELIAAQARKVEVLKTYKQGLMQQIFPREGETQPRLRFPEFETAVDWVSKKLEDLAKRGSGHTPSKSKSEYYEGDIKWVSLADSKRLDAGLICETATSISAQGIKNSSAVLHPEGTVLISRDAGVGKSAVMATPMAVSQHFIVWTCHDQLLSNWFLYYVLQEMKPIFERNATGSTIKTIGLPFFKELQIAVPSLPEQNRIADCLASLDTLITAATQELDNLKTHKKGLMQQLFPSVEMIEH
jgi:type I restriction enzyme, S subunit